MKIIKFFILSSLFLFNLEALTKTTYNLSPEPIDVVIPCGPGDRDTVELCIQGIRRYGKDIRRIIVVSKEPFSQSAEWFDESKYPFSKEDIALEIFQQNAKKAGQFLKHPKTRIGWIYQQLLKLYAPLVIPEISSNVLILDADVILLNPMEFMTIDGEPFFTLATEYHQPYFHHISRLIPGLKRVHPQHSGVAHHMLFQKPILNDLYEMIYSHHKVEPWKAICRCIDLKEVYGSSVSEYEIYFNYAVARSSQVHPRVIQWHNSSVTNQKDIEKYQALGYSYIACHWWSR
jgi:hypothetical protein